ncbi:MAG: thermonuclease family protein [Halocynthiibacter sp.]
MTFRHHILPAALTLLLAFFLYWVMKPQSGALLLRATQIYVIDGDTIRVDAQTIRLTGFNTPEVRSAACEAERIAGIKAKEHLRGLIDRARDLRLILRLKRDGTPATDRYRRHLAQFLLDEQDVADLMVNADLAEPYSGGARRS